jgi:predicted transcriptional regulator
MESPGAAHELLVRRGALLRRLAADPTGKDQLVDDLDVSRSTVDRGLRELRDHHFAERVEGGYRQTLLGAMVLSAFDSFSDRFDGLQRSRPALELLPRHVDVDVALFEGVDVVEATEHDPTGPLDAQVALREAASEYRALAPQLNPRHVDTPTAAETTDDFQARVVLGDAALQRLLTDYTDRLAAFLAHDDVQLRQVDDDSLPFHLSIGDGPEGPAVGVLVYDGPEPRAWLANDTDAAVAWAESYFDSVWRAATPVDGPLED